jgi:ABC-2 type transport system permease protein
VRAILHIARKELAVLFATPVAWVVLVVVAFFSAQLFAGALDTWGRLAARAGEVPGGAAVLERMNLTELVVARLLGSVALFLVITAPFLSMRLLAEERRSGTFELLATAPVRPLQIVLGKYLAVLAILVAALALVAVYPALLAWAGRGTGGGPAVEWPTVASGLLGLFLLGAAALAVGLGFSAFTDVPVVAALLSLLVLLGLWLAPLFTVGASVPARGLAAALSTSEHLSSFLQGRLALADLSYYLSLVVLGLFAADRGVEARRWA